MQKNFKLAAIYEKGVLSVTPRNVYKTLIDPNHM